MCHVAIGIFLKAKCETREVTTCTSPKLNNKTAEARHSESTANRFLTENRKLVKEASSYSKYAIGKNQKTFWILTILALMVFVLLYRLFLNCPSPFSELYSLLFQRKNTYMYSSCMLAAIWYVMIYRLWIKWLTVFFFGAGPIVSWKPCIWDST